MTNPSKRNYVLGMSPAQFLKQYWQKKPLLVRGAFPKFRDPITQDELAGLSCEEGIESRLVMERGGNKPWQVILGPQQASRLKRLPTSHWTLLVQGVDHHSPGVTALLEPFRFIPDWRIDDVMISFAPRAGTVGPHIDSYDVFLLQGKGRRRWRLDSKAPHILHPGLDLRILKHFNAEEDWTLHPGDMLYLPPGLAHYGVALEDCLTYSIGFRAPSSMDLLIAAQERLMQDTSEDLRYQDSALRPTVSHGEISRGTIKTMRRLLEASLRRLDEADFNALIGQLLTEPKGETRHNGSTISPTVLRATLQKGSTLIRSSSSRLAFIRQGKSIELFVDGRRLPLKADLAFAAPLLTSQQRFSATDLFPYSSKPGFLELVASLVHAGAFQIAHP